MERGSYLLIETGMTVRGMDGSPLGTVVELVADENADIFRGIVLGRGGLRSGGGLFVPGEHITAVEAETVFTNLDDAAVNRLEAVRSGALEGHGDREAP
ncbi:MAG: PRC-barrel domain-containing protein [Cytophagales bacterium]|nr:PRC-barrel domain-containing protein [Armatimonadota bacterium]